MDLLLLIILYTWVLGYPSRCAIHNIMCAIEGVNGVSLSSAKLKRKIQCQTEDNRTKHETLLLILHYLEEEGMSQSAQTLRDETCRSEEERRYVSFFFFQTYTNPSTSGCNCLRLLSSNSPPNILINYGN